MGSFWKKGRLFLVAMFTLLLSVFFFLKTPFGFAEDLIMEFDPDEGEQSESLEQSFGDLPPSNEAQMRDQFREGYRQLFEFNEQEIEGLKAVLLPAQQDISSIDAQVQLISAQIERMKRLEVTVAEKIQGLEQLQEKFQIQDQLLALEIKGVLKKFEKLIVLFYRIKREFVMEDGKINLVQLFANTSSPADFLFQDYLLQKIQKQLTDHMGQLSYQQLQVSILRAELVDIQKQLQLYGDRVKSSAVVLAEQVGYQKQLLRERRDEAEFFRRVLEEATAEQKIIDQRIQELASGVSPRAYQDLPDERFSWPVMPSLGISAHFHDEGYQNRFGLEHNAIDIPTDQLTPVKAAMSGKVVKAHDGGLTGYSYLQLAHRNGFSTVYGHIYEFKVKEGEVVEQGQVIALSGGAFGTKGAGRLTTGPHLHFEILKDGEYVDPEEYLD